MYKNLKFCLNLYLIVVFSGIYRVSAQVSSPKSDQALAHEILQELISTNTVHSTGNTTVAAENIAKRLREAGFTENDLQIIGPGERNRNLIARIHGSGKNKPILLLGHLDVVEARREDWSYDPFQLTEHDGYYYGRGSLDMKGGVAILVENFIRMKKEKFMPDRDLILALTSGEESGSDYVGADWLIRNERPLIDAEFCINMDAGEPQMKNGKRIMRPIQVSEKGLMDLVLEVKNKGGHSSLPVKDNAIYRLSSGLVNMQDFDFPIEFSETTKSYFETMSHIESGQPAADMKSAASIHPDTLALMRLCQSTYYNALMRTTCVATELMAGHAINALPQSAKAVVNCRVLPGTSQEDVKKIITHVLGDSQIVVSVLTPLISNPPSVIYPLLMKKAEDITHKLWPGIPVQPVMGVGASDGKYLRAAGIPVFGISGIFLNVDDTRMHGRDERILVNDFYEGLEYEYELIKSISSN